jgi:nucleotide-binding universal stress UspA family protein
MHSAPVTDLYHTPGYRAEIERRLDILRLSDPDLEITTCILSGDPASQIVGWANETLCDAIVMRSSEKRGLVGRLVDNVSQRVKRLVHCPVILVPGQPADRYMNGNPGRERSATQRVHTAAVTVT